MDPAIVPEVPQQRGQAPPPRTRPQSRQPHEAARAARYREQVVTDDAARKAHQDRRADRPPRALRHVLGG